MTFKRALRLLCNFFLQNTPTEVAEFITTDCIAFTMTNETVESLEKLSRTEKREVINVDGDPFVLLHPDVHIKCAYFHLYRYMTCNTF